MSEHRAAALSDVAPGTIRLVELDGRQIVLATDRPIGFWEAVHRPRTIQYPFTVIQMQIGADGKGTGTLSVATKIVAHNNVVELENFATQPVMLTEITSKTAKP